MHIESATLPDGVYELVTDQEPEQQDAQANAAEVTEASNQSSEAQLTNPAQEGKPRSINPIFQTSCNLYIHLFAHLSF